MKNEFGYFKILVYRLLLVLALFELNRFLFILFNLHFFSKYPSFELISTFWYGILFDISAILYLNSIFIIISVLPFQFREYSPLKTFIKILFFIVNSLAIMFNIVDCEYFKFTNKRTGVELFKPENEAGSMLGSYLRDYWHLLLIFIAFVIVLVFLFNKIKQKRFPAYTLKSYLYQFLIFMGTMGLFLVGGRGGFQLKPIRPFDAARFVEAPLIPVVVNTPFNMIFTAQNLSMGETRFMTDEEAVKLYNPVHYPDSGKTFIKKNVVIIILESFGKEVVGFYNQNKGYTPFLDSICRNSLVFMDAYANDKSSNKGVPCVLASIPSWMEVPYLNSNYQSNRLNSSGELLKSKGYFTAFFHGARNGTMAFDNFISVCEFGAYYGLNEYPYKSDFDGNWGIYDEPYLQYVAKSLNDLKKPFCISVFTLSSHHPYNLPEKYKGKFKGGPHPIHKTIEYADNALKRFFETASKMPWFKNTIFVITADHSTENRNSYYQTMPGRYAIPLIFYAGDGSMKGKKYGAVQQIDIMPSVLSYLGYDKPYFAFGNDIFKAENNIGVTQFNEGIWQYIKLPYILHFDGTTTIGFYNYQKDPYLLYNLISQKNSEMYKMEMELKAIIQTYTSKLNQNRTHIDQ